MRSKTPRIAALAILMSGVLVVGTVDLVGAHEFRTRTTAKIRSGGPDGAQGSVSSRRRACRRNRLVGLYRVQKGGNVLVGWDRTNRRGMWEVTAALFAAEYFVKVTQRRLGKKTAGHSHLCRRAISPRVRL